MTRPGLDRLVGQARAVLPGRVQRVKVGVEAAGHYHQPLIAPDAWPAGWQVLELNPAHVTEQRRVQGRRRVKTDAIDLEAITELVLAGQGSRSPTGRWCSVELAAWARHRTRRVAARTATKNQLLGQLDRSFPGLTLALPDVLGTKVGRLVAEHFADPARLAALGEPGSIRFAATRDLQLRPTAGRAAGRGRPRRAAHPRRRGRPPGPGRRPGAARRPRPSDRAAEAELAAAAAGQPVPRR